MYVVPFSYHERRVSSEHSDGKIKQNIEIYINDVHMYNNHECAPHAPKKAEFMLYFTWRTRSIFLVSFCGYFDGGYRNWSRKGLR